MSFNRSLYDPCEYNTQLAENNSILTYNLDPTKFNRCNQCRVKRGVVGGNNVSLSGCNLVDVESDLRNQTRIYSSCPQWKYQPKCKGTNCGKYTGLPCGGCSQMPNAVNLPECNLVNYKPRITTTGINLNYPSCPVTNNPSMLSHCPDTSYMPVKK